MSPSKPTKHPFEGCRKILITYRDVKETSLLHIDFQKGIGLRFEVTLRAKVVFLNEIKDT